MFAQVSAALIASAKPVVVVGAQIARNDAWDEAIALAESLQAPVWVSPMSARNSFPENHRLFAGFLPAKRESIVETLSHHDLILALGAPVFPYHVEGFGPHIPVKSQLFQIVDSPDLASWAPIGTAIVSDLKLGIQDLLDTLPTTSRPDPPSVRPRSKLDGRTLSDRYLLQQIADLRPHGAVIVEEAPSSRVPMHDHLPMIERDTFYTCASGGLGYGLPAAIGVALGRPKSKVIALIGDGSSMYSIQGLWTAAQLNLPITYVIINNGRYEALQDFGRYFGLQQTVGTELPNIDFVGLALSQGCEASRVEAPTDLDDALLHAFASTGPYLLEVTVA
jgi:benzoylformate decarboxylase